MLQQAKPLLDAQQQTKAFALSRHQTSAAAAAPRQLQHCIKEQVECQGSHDTRLAFIAAVGSSLHELSVRNGHLQTAQVKTVCTGQQGQANVLPHWPLSRPTEQAVWCLEVSEVQPAWDCLEHFQHHQLPQATPVQTRLCHSVGKGWKFLLGDKPPEVKHSRSGMLP